MGLCVSSCGRSVDNRSVPVQKLLTLRELSLLTCALPLPGLWTTNLFRSSPRPQDTVVRFSLRAQPITVTA